MIAGWGYGSQGQMSQSVAFTFLGQQDPKGCAAHPRNLLMPSASEPARETATGGASRVVVKYGWAKRPTGVVQILR